MFAAKFDWEKIKKSCVESAKEDGIGYYFLGTSYDFPLVPITFVLWSNKSFSFYQKNTGGKSFIS